MVQPNSQNCLVRLSVTFFTPSYAHTCSPINVLACVLYLGCVFAICGRQFAISKMLRHAFLDLEKKYFSFSLNCISPRVKVQFSELQIYISWIQWHVFLPTPRIALPVAHWSVSEVFYPIQCAATFIKPHTHSDHMACF